MWSYPNLIPLDEDTVLDIAQTFTFDGVYGGWWGRVVVGDAAAVHSSETARAPM